MNARKFFTIASLIIVLSMLLASCGSRPTPAPQPQNNNFIPLPKPAMGTYGTTLLYTAMGGGQLSQLISPRYGLHYGETRADVGKSCSETFEIYALNRIGTMNCVQWGDWQGGTITTSEYFAANDELILGGVVELQIDKATIIQWLTRGIAHTVDRSYVSLVYIADHPGDVPQLKHVVYSELWGLSATDAWAMGATAVWDDERALAISNQFHQWGFWEYSGTPFDQVTLALDSARVNLESQAPSFLAIDRDSARELIGRQSGFTFERNGEQVGDLTLVYDNLFGVAPNTTPIGSGSLSRLEWRVNDKYFALLMLTPQLSPQPSTLYVLVDDPATADAIEAEPHWVNLYPKFRQGAVPHVLMAIHAIGNLKVATSSTQITVQEGDSSNTKDITIRLGTVGGVTYTCIGKPSHDNIVLLRNLLGLMGKNGIKATGLYFPYKTGSGSGLDYYLAGLQILTSPEETALNVWGQDIGVIDRVGYPDTTFVDSLAVP